MTKPADSSPSSEPTEPPPSRWKLPKLDDINKLAMPDVIRALDDDETEQSEFDLAAIGADLAAGTVLNAYRNAMFPMNVDEKHLGWWSPVSRGILPIESLKVSRSLNRSVQRFDVRIDTSFEAVVRCCAESDRRGNWINNEIVYAYTELHNLGWAHSVECWNDKDELVGGLYGVAINGLFAGESMFHRERDASKVALVKLVEILRQGTAPESRLLDVQWRTPHLASLGVVAIDRPQYCERLRVALELPLPPAFARNP